MGQEREADNAMQQEEEQAEQMSQVTCRFGLVDSKDSFSSGRMVGIAKQQTATSCRHMLHSALMFLESTKE